MTEKDPNSHYMERICAFTKELAFKAGDLALKLRESGLTDQDFKRQVELVTSADLEVSELICSTISETYPDHFLLTEESEGAAEVRPDLERPTWIIDPIDGTVGYARGHFQFGISIAYCERGKIRVGVVNFPALKEIFWAIKGFGAFKNGQRIHVSRTEKLKHALVATGFPHGWEGIDRAVARLGKVRQRCRDVRRSGSAAFDLCWVACGRIDAYYEEDLKAWDLSGGKLIAIEAGAEYGFFSEDARNELPEIRGYANVTGNPLVYAELLPILEDENAK